MQLLTVPRPRLAVSVIGDHRVESAPLEQVCVDGSEYTVWVFRGQAAVPSMVKGRKQGDIRDIILSPSVQRKSFPLFHFATKRFGSAHMNLLSLLQDPILSRYSLVGMLCPAAHCSRLHGSDTCRLAREPHVDWVLLNPGFPVKRPIRSWPNLPGV